jgi:signal transduction histidine kinase
VLRNLISNAIKYSYPKDRIEIRGQADDGRVIIEISDHGTGITKEEQDKIFSDTHFSKKGTAAENGTGLGLRLCREFVQLHGGKIEVISASGQGSTFRFSVPGYQ